MNRIYTFGLSMALAAGIGMSANAEEYALLGSRPADGAVVKSVSELKLLIPTWDEENNKALNFTFNYDKFVEFNISKDGEPVFTVQDLEGMDSGTEYVGEEEVPTIILYFSEPLTTDGEYTIHVPAESFMERAEELGDGPSYFNAEYTSTFTIDSSALSPLDTFTLTPAGGTELESIESISLVFPNVTSNEWNYMYPSGKFTNGMEDYDAFASFDYSNEEGLLAFNVMPMKDDEPVSITKAGEWTLVFDAGSIGLKDGTTNENSIRATYTVVAGVTAPKYTLDPAPDSTIDKLEFTISFQGATKAEFVGSSASIMINATPMAAIQNFEVTEVEAAMPTFKITPAETAMKLPNGTITLIIDEGAFVVNGKNTEEIVASYTLDQPVSTDWVADPYEGPITIYSEGFYFTFIFDETATISIPEKSDITITINNEELPAESYDVMGESNMLLFGCYDKTYYQAGTLKVAIKEGAFKIGTLDSPAIEHQWELVLDDSVISGIDSVLKSNGNVTVFSIDGKKLIDNVTPESLSGLRKGVYVINGKKVLVK